MAAGHLVGSKPTAKQIFLTNRAIAHVLAGLAVVVGKEMDVNAHSAIVTVQKVLSTTHATKAAVFAMIRTFSI